MSVSIGLPYTDQGELLGLAIRSVLAQSYQDWELILIGDKPDDKTRSIARLYDDPRIRHYENASRMGLAATLNRISRLARYELVARMDGDDIMHPLRIELQKKRFDQSPSLDVLGTRAYLIDDNSDLAGIFKEPDLPKTGAGYFKSNAFTHPTVMAKRDWFLENPYDESLLRGEDKELWLRTWSHSRFEKLPDPLLYYRRPRSLPARRMQRDEAYNRLILAKYNVYDPAPHARVKRNIASHLKQALLGLIGTCGLSPVLFNTKWLQLGNEEFLAASRVLTTLKELSPVSPSLAECHVVAATVTYSNRYPLVVRTAQAALTAGATKVIIVDNGSEEPSKTNLRTFSRNNSQIELVALDENRGSAVGFGEAITSSLGAGADYVWLLDDDNECDHQALQEILRVHENLESSSTGGPIAVCALRPSNTGHAAVARGTSASHIYPPKGSFMYFDVAHRLMSVARKLASTVNRNRDTPHTAVPYAPYGGLLVSRQSIEIVGLPNPALGLYEDDTEYTARFWQLGGKLALATRAVVQDIDAKWTESNGHSGLAGLLHATDSRRTFFAVRNRVAFDIGRSIGPGQRLRLRVNEIVFRAALWATAIRYRKLDQAKRISRAINAGLNGDFSRTFSH